MKKQLIGAAAVVLLGGCASQETLLFDVAGGTTARPHCTVVADPFGGTGKVVVGEPVENDANKTTFINAKGFFVIPPEWAGSVFIRLGVRGSRKLKVQMVAQGRRPKTYRFELPTEGTWCEVELPIRNVSDRAKPGDTVFDFSIWQLGGGRDGRLYVDRAMLRVK